MTKQFQYIQNLLQPVPSKTQDRRVWGVELYGVWIPFFTATNAEGVSAIPAEALGAPLRLQKNQDGTPKFTKSGRPQLRVVKEVATQVRIVKENFVAGIRNYADAIAEKMPDQYQATVDTNKKAGEPITDKDMAYDNTIT